MARIRSEPINLDTGDQDYDVLVIGGGIQGAGVAQVCALNKLKVLLLEQFTIGSQTSSRSSKLIHGGLRYLESWQWRLVRECLREREILLKIAPDLVKLVPFYIPVYQNTSRHPLVIRLGLSLYALLGGLSRDCRFNKVPRQSWNQLEGLKTDSLQAVYQYYDAQTDDLLLTKAVISSAIEYGATVIENSKFIGAKIDDDNIHIQYRSANSQNSITNAQCSAKLIINAAGPWVNQSIQRIYPKPPLQNIEWVQGTHIIIDYPLDRIYYLEAVDDRRAIFAMPWKGKSLVGTTERNYAGDPAKVLPLATEVYYLKNAFAYYFPDTKNLEVLDSFAGLRVLPSAGEDSFKKSRETLVASDNKEDPRVISICGGKLTTYRHTAELVYKKISKIMGLGNSHYRSTEYVKLKKPI